MLKNLFLISLMILSLNAYNQVCLGTDTTVCTGDSYQINVCGQISGSLIGFMMDNPTQVNLSDDSFSGAVNIGFSFSFYGNTYTQCVIGSNGLITFDLSKANGYNAWSLNGTPLPNAGVGDANNSAMLCYHDINPSQGGQILYQTVGTAPNRRFYVCYANIPMFSSGECAYQSLILYEGSNIIDFYISHKPLSLSNWNGSLAIQGVQNANGTAAVTTPGRNNQVWTTSNDGQRYTPTAPNNTSNYTVTQVPYVPIYGGNITFAWENTNGQTFPYNNGSLNVNNAAAGSVGYYITISGQQCQSLFGSMSDTTFVTGVSSSVTATSVDDICSAGIGSVTANPTSGTAPYSYVWTNLGNANTQTVNGVSAGTYNVEMTDNMGCVSTASVTVGDIPANYPTSSTLASCAANSDGTATASMNPPLGNISYLWNDPNNQTTGTAVGLSAGTYECIITSDVGCVKIVEVTVDNIPEMQITVLNETDATCNSGNDGIAAINVTNGNPPYFYSWQNSSSNAQAANDLPAGTHTATVTDSKGCIMTAEITIGEPPSLFVSAISQDTIICIGDTAILTAQGGGGSSPYIYEWTQNGNIIGTGNNFPVSPIKNHTEYCVVVSEVCGSPSATACTYVHWPDELDPMVLPDKVGDCFPVEVTLENITNSLETISYTIWSYSDGDIDTVQGMSPVSHLFGEGLHNVQMTIYTNRGCVYNKNFLNLIHGYSNPTANFYLTPTPVSMYDAKVRAINQSVKNIETYQWYAEGAEPTFSDEKDPYFKYPNEEGIYPIHLYVIDENGCTDSITKMVRVRNDVLLFAPNSFTPDGDGYNETWGITITGIDVYNFHLEIYNRWGEKVFESFDVNGHWDGTYGGSIVKDGSYIWKIRAYDYDNDSKYEFNGTVNVIR